MVEFNKRISASDSADKKTKLNLSKCELTDEHVSYNSKDPFEIISLLPFLCFAAVASSIGVGTEASIVQVGIGRKQHFNSGKPPTQGNLWNLPFLDLDDRRFVPVLQGAEDLVKLLTCQLELFSLLEPAHRLHYVFLAEISLSKSKLSVDKAILERVQAVSKD
jgi:hypothetical protein